MPTPEGKVKAAVKKALQAEGVHLYADIASGKVSAQNVNGFFYMPVAGPFSVLGIHDFVGCWCGMFFSAETKAPDEPVDATHHQQMFKLSVDAAGGASYIGVRDTSFISDLKARVEKHLGRKIL